MPPAWAEGYGYDAFGPFAEVFVGEAKQRFRWVPSGLFRMGSPPSDSERFADEIMYDVELTRGYWLADTPVAQDFWQAVMEANPARFVDPRCPVERVSWHDAQAFIARVNELRPGLDLGLPTEAQWEYACRAGTTASRYGDLDEVAWWSANSGGRTHPVGQKAPNAWGLYDMLGNVWEWCVDRSGSRQSLQQVDPTGPTTGLERVTRGGCVNHDAKYVRAAYRSSSRPDYRSSSLGFRLARG